MKITKNIILGLGAATTSLVLASTVLSCASNPNYDLKKLNIKANYPDFDSFLVLDSGEIEILKNNTYESNITLTDQNLNDIFPILEKLFNFSENNIPSTKLLEWNKNKTISITSSISVDSFTNNEFGYISFRLRGNINGVNTDYNFIDGNKSTGSSHWRSSQV